MIDMNIMNALFSPFGTRPAIGENDVCYHSFVPGQKLDMNFSQLKKSGHWPTLVSAFLYFDFSFMAWTLLGPLGAQIGDALHLSAQQKGLMVAVPVLSGAFLRIVMGLAVDNFGAKATGITGQI